MNVALIATVFNEAKSIGDWLDSVAAQTRLPEEIIIVDGGSTDETPMRISEFFSRNERLLGKGKLLQKKCNIAEGRNSAIASASSEIIVGTDAGSKLDPTWLEAMMEPFQHDADLVGGWTESPVKNRFQERIKAHTEKSVTRSNSENYLPSSRTVAFRKIVWEAVGGYPEWLTLTGEDALFNANLKAAGFEFVFQPKAVVYWEESATMSALLKQMYSYGYGAAEARLFTRHYFRWMLTTFCPPLIFFSKHPIRDVPFRFLRNAASAMGWLAGKIAGKKPPADWKLIDGVLLSPETQTFLARKQTATGSLHATST